MAGIDFIHQNGIDYEIVPEIAPLFKTTVPYYTGDHVIYGAKWYTFKADKAAGAWDATKVDGPFEVADQLMNLKENLSKIATLTLGKNLVNNDNVVAGFIQSDGTISTVASYAKYATTDFVELEANTNYAVSTFLQSTLNKTSNQRYGTLLFDSSHNPISGSYINEITTSSRIINSGNAKFIRISYPTVDYPQYVQLEKGTIGTSYEPYTELWVLNGVFNLDGSIKTLQEALDEKISTVKHASKNLINPSTVLEGTFLTVEGTITDLSGYATCDYIPIKAGESVTFSPSVRSALLFDESQSGIRSTYFNDVTQNPVTMTATVNGYVRASFFMSDKGMWQAEYGTSATPYTPFDNNNYFPENIMLSDTMKAEVEAIGSENGSLHVVVNDQVLTVTGSGSFVRIYHIPQSSRNLNFNFVSTSLDGVNIKDSTDDITPQRVKINTQGSYTVGANHGWACYRVPVGELTSVDVGSVWTDGDREFTLAIVDANYARFLFPCTKEGGSFYFDTTAPVSNLSHVSGATHTASVSISGGILDQLYPSVNHNSITVKINGKTITENGVYHCEEFDVVEHYEIMDYAAINVYLKSHVGVELVDVRDNIESVLALDYVYHITPNGEVVYSTATAIEEVTIKNSGFMQASIINANGNTIYRYANGVKTDAFFNSAELVDMTDYNTNRGINKSDLLDSSKPTNRCVDIAKNSNGQIQYGFAFGFIPDIGDGADAKRANLNSSFIWDMRDSKKSYPLCIIEKTLAVGNSINVVGYRHYITEPQEETNKSVIQVGNKKYVFIDSHALVVDAVNVNTYGESVTVLDSSSMNVSDVVGAKGITFDSNANYSYAVLKLS